MIIVKLMGGLGNQMFQYAAGRSLAGKHNTSLKLDTSFLKKRNSGNHHTVRNFGLDVFAITASRASNREVRKFMPGRKGIIGTLTRFFQKPVKTCFFKEKHFHYDPEFQYLPDNTYLEGFWQSEAYFSKIAPVIREEFRFRLPLTPSGKQLALHISNCNAVGIHIRRGDYVSNAATNNYHGTCSIDYYHLAVLAMAKRVKQPEFFIFSDDPSWARSNLKLNYPMVIVEHNPGSGDHEDMHLMSLCSHQIIANSSFSWWGAWLNENPAKNVVAPKKWFNHPDMNTSSLIPETWIRI